MLSGNYITQAVFPKVLLIRRTQGNQPPSPQEKKLADIGTPTREKTEGDPSFNTILKTLN
jgi:hypothetical protein